MGITPSLSLIYLISHESRDRAKTGPHFLFLSVVSAKDNPPSNDPSLMQTKNHKRNNSSILMIMRNINE